MGPPVNLSLGLRTEMMFHRFGGLIADRGEYWVVKTPSNPEYYFGNFLLFFEAPGKESLGRWKELFEKEFSSDPAVGHYAFLWDSPNEGLGDVADFRSSGFKVDTAVVLTAKSVHVPAKMNHDVEVRPLHSDEDWREATECQIYCNVADYQKGTYRAFKEKQMDCFRAMAEQGMGHWFGAFLGGRLVGDLGLYKDETLGRFQSVETRPDYRRQGICSTLVFESARYAIQNLGVAELVMVADENYHAAKIYESVGFAPSSKEYSALWWKRTDE